MWNKVTVWIEKNYRRIINSIAFVPALIVILFLGLSILMISFDFSESGKKFKASMHWLSLKDASTARTIISAIVAGIISLAVFSFSMVMIVLNQAASQMSNRVLDKLIGNRFQQFVLGTYIGTIIYALFLLSTIRDIDSGIYVPALSTYLLIFITVFDIILFIYFLHYVTQSVKYEVIIDRICKETMISMKKNCSLEKEPGETATVEASHEVLAVKSGIYEGFNAEALKQICREHECNIVMLILPGNFILKGLPVAMVSQQLSKETMDELKMAIHISINESIEGNFFYGFRQLTEVAVKALSPGVNDPGTAIVSLRSLFVLFAYRIRYFPHTLIPIKDNSLAIATKARSFSEIFLETALPIWDYGKKDQLLRAEMKRLLPQLLSISHNEHVAQLLQETAKADNSHS